MHLYYLIHTWTFAYLVGPNKFLKALKHPPFGSGVIYQIKISLSYKNAVIIKTRCCKAETLNPTVIRWDNSKYVPVLIVVFYHNSVSNWWWLLGPKPVLSMLKCCICSANLLATLLLVLIFSKFVFYETFQGKGKSNKLMMNTTNSILSNG